MTQDPNPYRPPQAAVEAAPARGVRPLAGKGRRFLTLVIDYICFRLMLFVFFLVMYAVQPWRIPADHQLTWATGVAAVMFVAYCMFFEGLLGRTPAKMILGTKVTDLDGNPPTLGAVFKRTMARFVPLEGFTFFGERGFHDRVSKTLVIRKR